MAKDETSLHDKEMPQQEPIRRFWGIWQDLNAVYEQYARLQGISYTSLIILDQVYNDQLDGTACTQKSICTATLLPKQTTNAIISGFVRDGIVELVPLPHDRRAKAVRLTEKGLAYARRIVGPSNDAEVSALAQLSDAEQEQFLATLERFATACAEQLRAFEARGADTER